VLAVGVVAVYFIAFVLGDFAVQQGLRYLMGKTCTMGAPGAYVHGLDAIVFDLPLALATVLLVVLPWRRLPRRAHVALLAGLAAAIIVPLGALGSTFVFRCLNLCSMGASIRRRRTMTTRTQRAWGLIVWAALAFLCAAADCSGSGSQPGRLPKPGDATQNLGTVHVLGLRGGAGRVGWGHASHGTDGNAGCSTPRDAARQPARGSGAARRGGGLVRVAAAG
jgi:hypothetical protein